MDTMLVAAEVWEKVPTVAKHCSELWDKKTQGQGTDSADAALRRVDWLAMHIHTITGKVLRADATPGPRGAL